MTRINELMSENINLALVLFVGQETSPFPAESEDRVLNEFGKAAGADLVAKVRLLLAELNSFQPDWSTEDLIAASKRAVAQVRARHPAIDASGASALEWCYSYWWK